MYNFPNELIDFYNLHHLGKNPTYNKLVDAQKDLSCSYYEIKFHFDPQLLLQECKSVDQLFFNHRSQDKKKGYGHRGWQSLTLHGLDKHKTEHYTRYGFTSLEDASYKWTDASDLVPNLTKFLQSLPYKIFDRVRIMKLAAGGYIMPHSDGPNRIFSPLNIAINNPPGCEFVFHTNGVVPFKGGSGMILDVAREHMVINRSDESRYHIIVHGFYSPNFLNY